MPSSIRRATSASVWSDLVTKRIFSDQARACVAPYAIARTNISKTRSETPSGSLRST